MTQKPAVILWLYDTDLTTEFLNLLSPIKNHIKIFLGLCTDSNNQHIEYIFKQNFSDCCVEYFPNIGVDVLPTIELLKQAQDHKYIYKLHSKKSLWGNKKVNWRVLLNNAIVGDNFMDSLSMLKRKDIGMVGCSSFICSNNEHTNHNKIIELCNRLNIDYNRIKKKQFIAGNVFACKNDILSPIIKNYDFLNQKLKAEKGKVSDYHEGTYCHSLERIFGYLVEYSGSKIFGLPIKSKTIFNPKVPNHKIHLIINYDNTCYISENPNIHGNIILKNNTDIKIKWNHQQNISTYKYNKINKLINSLFINE